MILRNFKIKFLACVTLFTSINCFAQDTTVNRLTLDGTWEIIFDDKNEGMQKKWFQNENFEKSTLIQEISVPSCWEEFEKNYEGAGIYRKKFTAPKNWNKKVVELNFDAVNYKSEIWLNDQVVGFHEGGYTPFKFRVDKLLKLGKENTLIVRVISPIILTDKNIDGLGRQEVPMWRGAITGGIWQSVSISAKGTTGIKDVFIEPKIKTNTATFNIDIENVLTDVETTVIDAHIISMEGITVSTKSKTIKIFPGKNSIKWVVKIPNTTFWGTENPYLYTAKVVIKNKGVISDTWSTRFGMREFTVVDNQFNLNGKPLYLKATFFEGLYPVGLAYPDSKEIAIKEIRLAKEAGFNMIRPWRKPAPQMWLDLCDEMGILTVGSMAVECMQRPISTPRLPFVVENELRQTILSNRNRTSIVQWELFNEINRPILSQMLNSMSVLARELDPTRMILDESGGWGEGANIYLPYERIPMKFNDIHHYSGSQINKEEFNGYLATAKTKEELKEKGLQGVKGYGRNVVPGLMAYVSEIGYGSTPNLVLNNKEFAEKGNSIVAPTIYHKSLNEDYKKVLKKVGFDNIYPEIEAFYLEQQKMHGIANKRMLEATRLNSTVAGYCVHALVGGDWVIGAGLLDLWRNPKTLVYEMTKEANKKQITPIRILPRNVYAEEGTNLEVFGVNELKGEDVKVSLKIINKRGKTVYQKSFTNNFKTGISSLFKTSLDTKKFKGSYTVKVTIRTKKGKIISQNSQTFDVFTKKDLVAPKVKVAIVDINNLLANFFTKKGIAFEQFTTNTNLNIPVIVGKSSNKDKTYKTKVNQVRAFIKKGGKAIFLEISGKKVKGFYRSLPEVDTDDPFEMQVHGKWATLGGWAAKSHITTKHPIFKGLPTEEIMYGVYENIHPHSSLSKLKGEYIAGMIGYDHFPNNDLMVRHYNGPGEVWWAADVLQKNIGEGKMIVSTLRILEHLGKDPVAEKVLFNMINFID